MGVYSLHSSTVGLIWNLDTNFMSLQFHVFYRKLFRTVHSAEGEPPAKWPVLIVFDHFRSDFGDSNFVPELANKWLTPVDLVRRRESELNHQNQAAYQNGATPQRAPEDAPTQRVPPQDDTATQRATHDTHDQDGTTVPQREPHQIEYLC